MNGADVFTTGDNIACQPCPYGGYWKNNDSISVPGATVILSVGFAGNDLYAVGYGYGSVTDSTYYACVWKNNVRTILGVASNVLLWYSAIVVSGNDLYVPCVLSNSIQNVTFDTLAYWKNGQINYVDESENLGGHADFCIAVSGLDVYMFAFTSRGLVLWKNASVQTILPDTLSSSSPSASFVVSGTDVYIPVKVNYKAAYWKNGTLNYLSNGSGTCCIAVSGSDIYIAGADSVGNIALWKNGVEEIVDESKKWDPTCIFVQ